MAEIRTSIIIPVYNSEAFLGQCLGSVLAQETGEYEIIIVDDGSQDGSLKIAREKALEDPRIRVIAGGHHRQGSARNTGINEAKGKYVLFLDSDDMLNSDAVDTCFRLSEEYRLDVLTFDAESIDESGNRISAGRDYVPRAGTVEAGEIMSGADFWLRYHNAGGIYYSAPLHYINRRFLTDNALYFETGIFFEDNDWLLRLYASAQRTMYVNRPLYVRRYHKGQTLERARGSECIRSCLRIHAVLKELLLSSMREEIFKDMVFNVFDLNTARIRGTDSIEKQDADGVVSVSANVAGLSGCDPDIFDMDCIFLSELSDLMLRSGCGDNAESLRQLRADLVKRHYMLSDSEKKVGIFGTGIICEKFIRWYRETAGGICADLVFIETEPLKSEFLGCPTEKITDIKDKVFDNIITAVKAETSDKVSGTIKEILGEEQKITAVHSLLFDNRISYYRDYGPVGQ